MSNLNHDGEEQTCGSFHTGNPNCLICRARTYVNWDLNPKETKYNDINVTFLVENGFKLSDQTKYSLEFQKENLESNIGVRIYLNDDSIECEIYNTITFFTTNNECIRKVPNVSTKQDVKDIIRLFAI